MLAQKLILSYFSKILIQLLQMVAMFIVARIVGPSVLGVVAFGLAFVSMFNIVADLGLSSAHIKLISEGQDESKCIGTFTRLKILLTIIYVLVTLSFFLTQKYVFNVQFDSKDQEIVIYIYLVINTISQLFYIANSTFAGKTEQAKQDLPNIIQTFAYQILRIVVVLLGFRAIGLSVSNLIAVILVIPIYVYLFKGYKIGKFDKSLAKRYMNISLPVIVILISQTIVFNTDRVILQYLTNSEEVGYYAAGFSLSQFIRLIESSAGLLFFPLFSSHITNSEYERMNQSVKKYEKFNFAFVLPLVAVVSICSDLVVRVTLGQKFINTIPVLGIITISMYVSVINLPYINMITGKGLFRLSAGLYVMSVFFFILSAFIFVSPITLNLRGVGIALSLLMSNLSIGIMFMLSVKKKIPEAKVLSDSKLLFFGITYSLVALLIYQTLIEGVVSKIIFITVFIAFYIGFTKIFRMVNNEDYRMIKELIDYKKMYTYIKDEVKRQ
ncbi:MAG: oligosaccharide flippase family protein [Ignavibacteria bacterium]